MTPKTGPLHELVEPLQSFLQSFTQELTEQQFIPAFRDELRRLVSAIDNLQHSEESLQQIARGVDRLREVFAPAGTRLLEGVKDLETVMQSNANDLRDRSGQVMKDLLATHDQLETALRNEAGVLQEQTSASREALARTVADVEGRLQSLTATIESLCRKMETEVADLVTAPRTAEAAPQTIVQAGPVTVTLPEELQDLLRRTEATVQSELQRQRSELLSVFKQNAVQSDERVQQLDRIVEQALSSVGPRVHEEMDQALEQLREQLQTFVPASPPVSEASSPAAKPGVAPVAHEEISGSLAASEKRILNELSALRKTLKSEQASAEKAIKDLAKEYDEAARRQIADVNEHSQQLTESLAALHNFAGVMRHDEQATREQLTALRAAMDALSNTAREQDQRQIQGTQETAELLRTQSQQLAQRAEEERQVLTQLGAAMGRAEQAATTATERAHSESRMLREKIDTALKDLAERMQRDTASETGRVQDTLRQLAQAWQAELASLRDDITRISAGTSETLADQLAKIHAQITDAQRTEQTSSRDLHTELGRVATALDDKVTNLQTATESFTEEMQTHVKAVANEVAKQRASQEQALAVLKEAIRANYDENAARLKEVIEGGYDTFTKQIATVPQALERYTHLIQSLYQGEQLALQAISSDTKNILGLTTEKFEQLVTDGTAIKKFFPLLDRKMEKHSQEIEAVRKAQSKQDKELGELKQGIGQAQDAADKQVQHVKKDIQSLQHDSETRFTATQGGISQAQASLEALKEQDLPAFRREFATLLSTKFDLMETSVRERQEALRGEILQRLEHERQRNGRVYLLLGLLATLAVAVQVSVYFLNHIRVQP